MLTDPISDYLTRIRNGLGAAHGEVAERDAAAHQCAHESVGVRHDGGDQVVLLGGGRLGVEREDVARRDATEGDASTGDSRDDGGKRVVRPHDAVVDDDDALAMAPPKPTVSMLRFVEPSPHSRALVLGRA